MSQQEPSKVERRPFDGLADQLFDQIWEKPSDRVPETVYHYTNAEGLEGILINREIWATDYRFLNDETESELGNIIARGIARKRALTEKSTKLRRLFRSLLECLAADADDPNFIFSLSSRRDDLTQWRTYAREGRGFTIGFETKVLIDNSGDSQSKYGFSKVIYNSKVHESRVKKLIGVFEDRISHSTLEGVELNNHIEEAALTCDWLITSNSALFKHSSFQAEREWRINTYYTDEDSEMVKVRASNGRLVPYMALKLCSDKNNCLPITHIGIGPGFKDIGMRYAVEKLCEQTGFSVEIYNADTPFRRT